MQHALSWTLVLAAQAARHEAKRSYGDLTPRSLLSFEASAPVRKLLTLRGCASGEVDDPVSAASTTASSAAATCLLGVP